MRGYEGTTWMRNTDGMKIAIVNDKQAHTGATSRPLRAKRETGMHFWISPSRLERQYRKISHVNLSARRVVRPQAASA